MYFDTHPTVHRLSQINTQWSMVMLAHGEAADEAGAARSQLLQRYGSSIYRYLVGILHDTDAADELSQEFALRFLRGDFRRAAPERGRFRDLVKAILRNMVVDYKRKQTCVRGTPAQDLAMAREEPPDRESDLRFLADLRDELLARSWQRLADAESHSREPLYQVLRFRSEHPAVRSATLAEQLAGVLGKPLTAAGVRQTLHRARARFADYLLHEVASSLSEPSHEELREELSELGLLLYCESALRRRSERA
jgi:RNA polymerase sigma-70 factor (ECF subfamily)